MRVTIKDIRSLERASVDIAGATIVAGPNGAGKSTLLRTVAGLVTGAIIPEGMKKSEAGALVRVGCAEGVAKLFVGDGEPCASLAYPKGDYETQGDPVRASLYAAGLRHVDRLPEKERAEVLQEYIGSKVNKEDFDLTMSEEGFSEKAIAAAWAEIEKPNVGWDGLLKQAKDHGKKLKGKWEEVTGADYGSKIGGTWLPDGWSEDLAGATEETLTAELAAAQAARDEALKNVGADQAVMERLREVAAKAPTQEAIREAQAALDAANKELQAKIAERAALPTTAVDEKRICNCPECGADIVIRPELDGTFKAVKPVILKGKEKKEADTKIAQLDGEISRLRNEVKKVEQHIAQLRADKQAATSASEELARLTGRTGSADAVEKAKTAVAEAERRLAAFRAKAAADRHHRNIQQNQKLIELLAPDGLRQRKMQKALAAFNDAVLAPLSQAAGWKPVEIDPSLVLRYGGRPLALCSESEAYRARATLQAALAQLDKSGIVIMDSADILDQTGRQQLVAGLAPAVGVPVLIGMTFSKRALVPDLAKAGLGASYWIEDGMVYPIAENQEAKAA